MNKSIAVLLLLLSLSAITACGGGGGGGGGGNGGTYSISGAVTVSGAGLAGVTLRLNTGAAAVTDAGGNYSFTVLPNGSYTITPSLAGYAFNPVNTLQVVSGANVTGVNFTATPAGLTHSISGTILVSGSTPSTGLAGATVSIFGTSSTAITDVNGNYLFTGLADGSYTLTPSMSGYTFMPTSRTLTLSGTNSTGNDFTAVPTTQPSRVTIKLSTAGTSTLIGSLNLTLQLPAGVTVRSTVSPPLTDPGVAYQSGNAASSELFSATYTAATGTMFLQLGSTTGFASGEFATIVCDVAPGATTPAPGDFTVLSFTAWDVDTTEISGVTTSISVSPSPAHARLKLSTANTTTTVGGVDVTIALPTGVTARSTLNPPETDPGVVFASGNAISNSLITGLYTSATRTIRVALINLNGFVSGEFATVICDLQTGVTPTAGDFIVQKAEVSGLYSTSTITGATVTVGVTLE